MKIVCAQTSLVCLSRLSNEVGEHGDGLGTRRAGHVVYDELAAPAPHP